MRDPTEMNLPKSKVCFMSLNYFSVIRDNVTWVDKLTDRDVIEYQLVCVSWGVYNVLHGAVSCYQRPEALH